MEASMEVLEAATEAPTDASHASVEAPMYRYHTSADAASKEASTESLEYNY